MVCLATQEMAVGSAVPRVALSVFEVECNSISRCFFSFSLAFLENIPHICNALHLKQATRFANFAVGIFYAHGCTYSSVPCGALMRPLPVSGVVQRGAELFLFPLRP